MSAFWVLTSASCLQQVGLDSSLFVHVSRWSRGENPRVDLPCEKRIRVAEKILYPWYATATDEGDIALMRLDESAEPCIDPSDPADLLQLFEMDGGLQDWSHYTNRIAAEVGWDAAAAQVGYQPLAHRREAQVLV